MRVLCLLAASLVLSGCAAVRSLPESFRSLRAAVPVGGIAPVVPQEAWSFDPTRPQPAGAAVTVDASLQARIAELQQQRTEIRNRIAAEPDARRRQALYAELHQVGMQLSPLERQVAALTR